MKEELPKAIRAQMKARALVRLIVLKQAQTAKVQGMAMYELHWQCKSQGETAK